MNAATTFVRYKIHFISTPATDHGALLRTGSMFAYSRNPIYLGWWYGWPKLCVTVFNTWFGVAFQAYLFTLLDTIVIPMPKWHLLPTFETGCQTMRSVMVANDCLDNSNWNVRMGTMNRLLHA
jgi:hypothetical protein